MSIPTMTFQKCSFRQIEPNFSYVTVEEVELYLSSTGD